MGDIADDLTDRMLLDNDFGALGWYDGDEEESWSRRPLNCAYCGTIDVHWRMTNGKWVVTNNVDLKRHDCPERYPVHEDFGPVVTEQEEHVASDAD